MICLAVLEGCRELGKDLIELRWISGFLDLGCDGFGEVVPVWEIWRCIGGL